MMMTKLLMMHSVTHPNRVYLFSNANEDIIVKFIKERYIKFIDEKLCILTIDKDRLVSCNMSFYDDPMFDDIAGSSAIFTTSTIPPSAINDKIKCFHLDSSLSIISDKCLSF